jgi:hypothetical protein
VIIDNLQLTERIFLSFETCIPLIQVLYGSPTHSQTARMNGHPANQHPHPSKGSLGGTRLDQAVFSMISTEPMLYPNVPVDKMSSTLLKMLAASNMPSLFS